MSGPAVIVVDIGFGRAQQPEAGHRAAVAPENELTDAGFVVCEPEGLEKEKIGEIERRGTEFTKRQEHHRNMRGRRNDDLAVEAMLVEEGKCVGGTAGVETDFAGARQR